VSLNLVYYCHPAKFRDSGDLARLREGEVEAFSEQGTEGI
jgi:hypothetical protein